MVNAIHTMTQNEKLKALHELICRSCGKNGIFRWGMPSIRQLQILGHKRNTHSQICELFIKLQEMQLISNFEHTYPFGTLKYSRVSCVLINKNFPHS